MGEAKPKKLKFVDISKGIGILLVVLGHTVVPEMRNNSAVCAGLFRFIYSFHMPLFVGLSGYIFELNREKYITRGFKRFALSKCKALILPYISFSILSYAGINLAFRVPLLADVLRRGGYEPTPLPSALFQIVTHIGHIDNHMWFVYALFFIFLISFLLRGLAKNLLFLLAVYAAYLTLALSGSDAPLIVLKVLLHLVYFNLARYITVIDRLTRNRICLPLLCASFLLLYCASCADWGVLGPILEIPVAVAGSLSVLAFARRLTAARAANPLAMLGNYSYDIYLIHQPFIVSGTGGLLLAATSLRYPVICAVTFVLGCAVPMILSRCVLRRYRILNAAFLGGR